MTLFTDPVWDESPTSRNLDDDLLLPLALATFEVADMREQCATSGMRKWKVTVLMVRTCWRMRRILQTNHGPIEQTLPIEETPLSRWRTCAYVVFALRRLKVTLPDLRAKRARNLDFLCKLYSRHNWTEKPLLHAFRSVAYGILFATSLSRRVSRNHLKCAPVNDALELLSAVFKVKLDDSLNAGKCKVLLQIFGFLETYMSIFSFILDNVSKDSARLEGLSACYYMLKEICRLLTQCKQYVRDCSGNFPTRRLFAKLESSSTIRGLMVDLDRCLQLLSIKVDDFVEKNASWDDIGIKSTPLKLFGPSMDFYLQCQAEKDQSDLLLKLKLSAKSFWSGLYSWRGTLERELLIARLEYERRPGHEIDYLKHGLCVDPKNVKVVRPLGAGSYGTVQEVLCFGERYAMKTIPSELENASEAIIQAGLEHPNIVKLIWYTTNMDPMYQHRTLSLLMEFMDMGLDAYLVQRKHQRRPPLSKLQLAALHILIQIARAMKYLHSQKIMHRDLKAANVLVDLSWSPDFKDGYLHVKVCDFGLSKVKQSGAGRKRDLNTAKVGTRYWRAPEVLMPDISSPQNSEDGEFALYSFSADVYSFGMTCYEILTGKKPFSENKQAGLKERIFSNNERPELPEGDLHERLVDLIKRCWDGRPEKRPAFDGICEELESIKEELLFGRTSPIAAVPV